MKRDTLSEALKSGGGGDTCHPVPMSMMMNILSCSPASAPLILPRMKFTECTFEVGLLSFNISLLIFDNKWVSQVLFL